jgi:hypothetical protein
MLASPSDTSSWVRLHHESGLILAGPNSREGGVLYDIEPGVSFADFVLDPMPFLRARTC